MSNQIIRMIFGSHLYGTATPSSDKDYKGIALPTWEQVALGKIPKHMEHSSTGGSGKNTSDDVDTEIFGIHEFIKLALEGQTVAMDMLHAPTNMVVERHERYGHIWDAIQRNREKFYCKNIQSFCGYAMRQASRYGIRGSRLNAAKEVLNWCSMGLAEVKLKECDLSTFPTGEYISLTVSNNIPAFDICGKIIHHTVTVGYMQDVIQKFYKNYGDRSRQAASNNGIDWKAISHAFRAAYQIKELLTEGTITFPRPEVKFLTEIKTGQLKYIDVAPILEDLIDEVKELKDKSTLPETPDRAYWNEFLMQVVEDYLVPFEMNINYV